MSQKVIDIVRGLAQAAADIGYDGAVDKDGEPVKIGMKREEGHPVYDSRTMDGFKINFTGPTLNLSYHADIKLKEVYSQDLEAEVGRMMSKIITALKSRYKANTGKGITLKKKGELDVRVESTSRVRVWVTAKSQYDIGGMGDTKDALSDEPPEIEKNFQNFLKKGGLGNKPENKNQRPKKS